MATLNDLSQRLLTRFKDVPNVSITDTEEWVQTALNEHGYSSPDNVPDNQIPLILLHAQAEGASIIALSTAHYFAYTDKDETIDKSKISDQYRKLATDIWTKYKRKKNEITSGSFYTMTRVDR